MSSYQALVPPEDIRLLHITPASYHEEDIHCQLTHHCRTDLALQYDALSYVWGDASKLRSIFVGSRRMMVTSNCYDALRRLRYENDVRIVWVDALCIDQSNNEEKTEQVRRMGELYAQAHQVIVYLGEADETSNHLFEILESERRFDPSLYDAFSMASLATVEATRRVLQRPWFSRVWVTQEVFFSQTERECRAIVVCGDHTFRWDLFANSCFKILKYNWSTHVDPKGIPHILFIGTGWGKGDVFATLCRSRSCHATDPRDKVFGILSLVELDWYGEDNASLLMQRISYSNSVSEVYTAVGLLVLEKYKLGLLQAIRRPSYNFASLASWIPDWSRTADNDPFALDTREPSETWFSVEFEELACCSPNTQGADHRNHPVLVVRGSCLDSIVSLGDVFDFERLERECVDALTRIFRDPDGSRNNRFFPRGLDPRKYDAENFRNFLTAQDPASDSPQYEKALHGFRLFLGDKGLFGIAPAEAACGDIVCALPTSAEACILRYKSADTQTMVSGDSYVLGTAAAHTNFDTDFKLRNIAANGALYEELARFRHSLADVRQFRIW